MCEAHRFLPAMISALELHPIRQRCASITHAELIPRWFPTATTRFLHSNLREAFSS
jgi:hypothetical protein